MSYYYNRSFEPSRLGDGTSSTRQSDQKQEHIITRFLNEKLYKMIYDDPEVVTADTVADVGGELLDGKTLQKNGVDIILHMPQGDVYHDIKAQSSPKYINNPRPTYAMELLTDIITRDGENIGTVDGWFTHNDLTDYYALVWIDEAKVNERGRIEKPEDIYVVEVAFVDKAALKQYLFAELLINDDYLLREAKEMRDRNIPKRHYSDGMTASYSAQLAERPVSLVISRDLLERFARNVFIVDQSGPTRVEMPHIGSMLQQYPGHSEFLSSDLDEEVGVE